MSDKLRPNSGWAGVFLLAAFAFALSSPLPLLADATQTQYLSGFDKDHTVDWEFFCTGGRNSGYWTTIPVPSNWELQGFGTFNYGGERNKSDEQGNYRHSFAIPDSWRDKHIRIVFEGVMTDAAVRINGRSAGPAHQGGFYRFSYDVTSLVRFGDSNVLEVDVKKVSDDRSVEIAERQSDYWVFGGIYRPVYLEALPAQHIRRTALDARADGSFRIDAYTGGITDADNITGQIRDLNGNPVGEPFTVNISRGQAMATLRTTVTGHSTWTAETPNLYTVELTLARGNERVHSVTERFGFRTIEVRAGDGVYLNGQKITLKGVNHHSFYPESGRTLSRELSLRDIRLMKEMNMNAVRMSHYPPDVHFLDLCDELGLYVLDELCTWQRPSLDTGIGEKLVKELVVRDVNHPSILFWDNGNEGGWNTELDDDFALYDPQNRTVLHPWEFFGGIDTDHYETYESTANKLASGNLFMSTEFLHGLYDGGHGAGLEDYWNLIQASPLGAGGFLWVFADEGIVRSDMNGFIDTQGNNAPDGIVGPYGEKEGSFYTIRDIWSPVQVGLEDIPAQFTGAFPVENRYSFINLNQCRFEWQVVDFHKPFDRLPGHDVAVQGTLTGPDVPPGSNGELHISLPDGWRDHDALYLTAYGPKGESLWTWTWELNGRDRYTSILSGEGQGEVTVAENDDIIEVNAAQSTFSFNASSGTLISAARATRGGNTVIPFGDGPVLSVKTAGESASSEMFGGGNVTRRMEDDNYRIESAGANGFDSFVWTVHSDGVLQLDYTYTLSNGKYDFHGMSFACPESKMLGMTLLSEGPYRVWKNRMRGTWLDARYLNYNNTTPGRSWEFPEFKGYFADLHWAVFDTQDGPIAVATGTPDVFLRMYTPRNGYDPRNTAPPFPDSDISFMHAIPPMGTKFMRADQLGPDGQPNAAEGAYSGTLYFRFGRP